MGSHPAKKRIVAFIPARGGSRSIPLKNIKKIAGEPLVYWSASACSKSRLSETFIATDSDEIAQCIKNMGLPRVQIIGRSANTATDTASTESAMLEFVNAHDFEHIALIQATSPLLIAEHIDGALAMYFDTNADSLLTVVRTKRFIWAEQGAMVVPSNYDPLKRPRRQDWQGQLVENGALYITSRKQFLSTGCRISGKIAAYEMPEESYFELDEPSDWTIIEQFLLARKSNNLVTAAAEMKFLCVDVDGTLTDGGMYYSETGELLKKFNTRDAAGMARLRELDIIPMIVTRENSAIVMARAKKLGIEHVFINVQDKESTIDKFLHEQNCTWEQVAAIGDDLNDRDVLQRAGISACPSDAADEIKKSVHYVCSKAGGEGAVREFCDLIYTAAV